MFAVLIKSDSVIISDMADQVFLKVIWNDKLFTFIGGIRLKLEAKFFVWFQNQTIIFIFFLVQIGKQLQPR